MDLLQKLTILGEGARYDASCASSGADRKGAFGRTMMAGICHSWAADGRCIALLKVLQSNQCMYRCAYCALNATQDIRRCAFTPQELADLTEGFYRRNYVEGLFLSSAVVRNADYTMEQMITTVRLLRERGFGGYIHMKTIPGASGELIEQAARLSDRMSVNIELPSEKSLHRLAPDKSARAILRPMGQIHTLLTEKLHEPPRLRKASPITAVGQSTQLIVGATPESDGAILRLSQALYQRYRLRRVYYSAYMPTTRHPLLAAPVRPPLLREHRLYQADWLMRLYGFDAAELTDDAHPMLDTELDPKAAWALRNPGYFPVELTTAPLERLLRVPGVGRTGALRIIQARRYGGLSFEDVRRTGVTLKRAAFFITCRGKYMREALCPPDQMRVLLGATPTAGQTRGAVQLSLFDPPAENALSAPAILQAQ